MNRHISLIVVIFIFVFVVVVIGRYKAIESPWLGSRSFFILSSRAFRVRISSVSVKPSLLQGDPSGFDHESRAGEDHFSIDLDQRSRSPLVI